MTVSFNQDLVNPNGRLSPPYPTYPLYSCILAYESMDNLGAQTFLGPCTASFLQRRDHGWKGEGNQGLGPNKGRTGCWVREGVALSRCDGLGVSPPGTFLKTQVRNPAFCCEITCFLTTTANTLLVPNLKVGGQSPRSLRLLRLCLPLFRNATVPCLYSVKRRCYMECCNGMQLDAMKVSWDAVKAASSPTSSASYYVSSDAMLMSPTQSANTSPRASLSGRQAVNSPSAHSPVCNNSQSTHSLYCPCWAKRIMFLFFSVCLCIGGVQFSGSPCACVHDHILKGL